MIKKELLNEQKVVSNYNLYIGICLRNSRPDYLRDPYFKVYLSSNPRSAEEVARISILRPEYIKHVNDDGKRNIKLNKTQISFVLKMLRDPVSRDMSGWQFMLNYLLNQANEKHIIVPYDINLQMPDYTQLK